MTHRTAKAVLAGLGGLALLSTSAHVAYAAEPPSGHHTIGPILHEDVAGAPTLELHCDEYARFSAWIDGNTGPAHLVGPASGLAILCNILYGGIPF